MESKGNKTKILFVHDGPMYEDEYGNVYGVHFKENIKKRYLQLGDSVTFCMRVQKIENNKNSKFSMIRKDNFNFVKFPNFKSIQTYFFKKYLAKQIIEREVKNHDILIARLPSASGTIAVRAARKHEIPFLVEFVACTFDAYWNYNWQGKLIAHFSMWQQQKIMKDIPYSIYVTKKFLQNRYPTEGKVINCSNVELPPIELNDLFKRLRKIDKHEENVPIILGTVGAINVPYKGQSDVIRAISELKRIGKIFKYYIVGQGNPKQLDRLIKKYKVYEEVKILGALPHKKVFKFLETIDVYIHPSKQEGLPRAIIEAMSKACPILGSKIAGIPELLTENCLFLPGSISEIKELLLKIDKKWMETQAKVNFESSKEYQSHILHKRRLDFFKEFLADHDLGKK